MSQKNKPSKSEKNRTDNELITFAFTKQNYRLLIIGIIFITLGFLLMIGGGSDDPKVFSDKIFNFQRLTLAPILIIAGYIIEIFAIMKRPKQ
jgi:cytochrome bd-type quinol oxidase subunit 2